MIVSSKPKYTPVIPVALQSPKQASFGTLGSSPLSETLKFRSLIGEPGFANGISKLHDLLYRWCENGRHEGLTAVTP